MRWRDSWEERFLGIGQTNAVIHELRGGKSVRVEVYCKTRAEAEQIQSEFGGSVRKLVEANWAQKHSGRRKPIRIRDRLIITAEADAKRLDRLRRKFPGREIVSIPPEMAFGTGDHATTATCLRFLVDVSRDLNRTGEPWDQLDLGAGSGILAIAGKKLGARRVRGLEFDPRALEVARRNVERHGVKRFVRLSNDNVLEWKPGRGERYDCVTANLFSTVLVAAFPIIARATKRGGHLVISGIVADQAEEVFAAGGKAGFEFSETRRKGQWVSGRARRS